MQTPKSSNRDDYQDIPRPLGGMPIDFPAGHKVAPHDHPRAQILYAISGVMEVSTQRGVWIVPPQRAAWLPAGVPHWMRTRTGVAIRSVFIRPDACPAWFPVEPCIVIVTPLLRELISEVAAMPVEYNEASRDGLVVKLLVQSLQFSEATPLALAEPRDPRLRRLYDALMNDPSDRTTLEEWATRIGASARTIARLIRAEAGVSFGTWRQQMRLLAALPRLASGEATSSVAFDVGYETPSAFTAMFKRHFGVPPSRYFRG